MGQGVSNEQIAAHLARQDGLIKQLQAVVEKQAKSLEATGTAVDYTQDGIGEGREAPDYLDDELHSVEDAARRRERFRVEPDIDSDEKALPNEEWTEPTEEEERGFMSVKPWLGAMAKPTGFEYGKTDGLPDVQLELEHVHGYRSVGVRSTVYWVDDHTIVYFAAAVGIVHDLSTNKQKFFLGHSDDIISMHYHADKGIVVTGEQGRYPAVYVWDVKSCQQVAKLMGFHKRGVCSVAFSVDGSRVASVGMDDDHSIAVYDWTSGQLLGSEKGDTNRILHVTADTRDGANGNTDFVTVGVKHVRLWSLQNGQLEDKKGLLGNLGEYQTFLTVACSSQYVVVGTAGGELYCFKGRKLAKVVDAHQKSIYSLCCKGDTLYSGGRDGYISKWNMNTLKKELSTNMNKIECPEVLKAHTNSVRSVDVLGDNTVIAGCMAGTISRVKMTNNAVNTVVHAHYGDLTSPSSHAELWGLYAGPGDEYITSGEDCTLRMWSSADRKMTAKAMLPSRAQTCVWSKNGEFVVVGLHNGTVIVYSRQLEELKAMKKGGRRIQCMTFSPNAGLLAVGTADNIVDIYDATNDFKHTGRLTGNSSCVLHVDFSADGKYLQTCSQAYELLFFDMETMKQHTRSRELKDVQWETFTSILGWDVQGIWPKESDGSDVNAVCRSHSGRYLATGEDTGLVKLFNYPCVGGGLNKKGKLTRRPASQRANGHSEHVTQVQWLANDDRLITVGGADLSCFQWKVVAATASE